VPAGRGTVFRKYTSADCSDTLSPRGSPLEGSTYSNKHYTLRVFNPVLVLRSLREWTHSNTGSSVQQGPRSVVRPGARVTCNAALRSA
jgi:hypothetical protein